MGFLFSLQLNYARYFLPRLLPGFTGRLIYLDDDVIVRGDLRELADTPLQPDHVVAFSSDALSAGSTYNVKQVRSVLDQLGRWFDGAGSALFSFLE